MYTYMKHKRVLYVYTLTPLPLSINNTTSATGAYYIHGKPPLSISPPNISKSQKVVRLFEISCIKPGGQKQQLEEQSPYAMLYILSQLFCDPQ
jgi:hypothetical protein